MKNLKYLFAAVLLACSTASFAQFNATKAKAKLTNSVERWQGLRFSYDRMAVRGGGDKLHGFSVDYVTSFSIAPKLPFFFETGLAFNYNHYGEEIYDIEDNSLDFDINTMGLTIPLNVVYGIRINDKLCFKPYTGFYFRINMMGKGKYDFDIDDKYDIDDDDMEDCVDRTINFYDKDDVGKHGKWDRCNVGWQIGGTLDINQFNVGIGYRLDFNEMSPGSKFGIFQAKVGYNF